MTKVKTPSDKVIDVFCDFETVGYTKIRAIGVGKIELRMKRYAKTHNISLSSKRLYIPTERIGHATRDEKVAVQKAVSATALANFAKNRRKNASVL